MCVPYDKALRQYHKFWTCKLDHGLSPSFKNFIIGLNFLIIRDRAFIFGMHVPCDKAFSNSTIYLEHVNLNVTFDLLLNNFNIGHNFFHPKR